MQSVLNTLTLTVLAATAIRADQESLAPAAKTLGHIAINLATGERTISAPVDSVSRQPSLIWDCSTPTGYFTGVLDRERLDWGDIANSPGSSATAFEFGYCSQAWTPDVNNGSVDLQLAFYLSENGFNTPMPPSTATLVMTFTNLPGQTDPNQPITAAGCWTVSVDLAAACAINPNLPCSINLAAAQDRDGDGLGDFGYGYFISRSGLTNGGTASTSGPLITLPTAPTGAPGADLNRYDRFAPPGKWSLGNAGYVSTFTATSSTPGVGDYERFQYHLRLSTGSLPASCPGPTNPSDCSCADSNDDGVVELGDLAGLLAVYGQSGQNLSGDCAGPCGKIDLADLAYTLGHYGNTGCTIP